MDRNEQYKKKYKRRETKKYKRERERKILLRSTCSTSLLLTIWCQCCGTTLVITDNKYFSTTAVAASSQLWSLLSSPAPLTVSPAAPALPSLPGEYNTSLTLSFSPYSQPQAENAQLTCQREATQSLCPGWKAHSTLHFSLQTIGNNTFKRVHVIGY